MSRVILVSFVLASFLLQVPHAASQESQDESSSPENSAANQPKPSADAKPDYSKESSVVEKYQVRLRFENDGTGRREETARIRVQSEAGVQRWGQLRFGCRLPVGIEKSASGCCPQLF
jgi:hypothetical protein